MLITKRGGMGLVAEAVHQLREGRPTPMDKIALRLELDHWWPMSRSTRGIPSALEALLAQTRGEGAESKGQARLVGSWSTLSRSGSSSCPRVLVADGPLRGEHFMQAGPVGIDRPDAKCLVGADDEVVEVDQRTVAGPFWLRIGVAVVN